MKRFMKVMVAVILTVCMLMGAVVAEAAEIETQWNVENLEIDVKAGQGEYKYMSIYPYTNETAAYEMSNHMVTNGAVEPNGNIHYDIPQTLVLIDAKEDYTWTPNGKYSFQNSNYEVLYCCDAETGYDNGVYYKRMNLEDSSYYNEESAAHIRGIVMNSYPYISLEQMKANLAAAGFEGADELTRADIITAVQAAIWAYANIDIDEYYYGRTFNVTNSTRWGGVMHDYTAEMGDIWWNTAAHSVTGKDTTDEAVLAEVLKVEARVNALIDYLKQVAPVDAAQNQVIITGLEVVDYAPIQMMEDMYTVSLRVELNNSGSGADDNIEIGIYVGDKLSSTQKVQFGQESYNFKVEAAAGETIKVKVEGDQVLPSGVYFYEADGGRAVSQSLVGVAYGATAILSEDEVKLPEKEKEPVKANVRLVKVDENGSTLSGAEFALYAAGTDGDLYVDTYAVDANGTLKIENLLTGSYKLVETKAPEGYVQLRGAIGFSIDENGNVTAGSLPAGVTATAAEGEYSITCVNVYRYTDISGQKTWNDDNDRDGLRPESIVISLLADGRKVEEKVVTAEDGWKWTFEKVEKFRNDGTEIVYTVEEAVVEGYTTVVDGCDVTNSHEIETIDIEGSKTWIDNDNNERTRPGKIIINLLADGVEVAEKSVTAGANWSWSFEDMPKYRDGGVEIVYTVVEDAVAGYESEVDGYNITNTLVPKKKTSAVVRFNGTKYLDDTVAGGFSFLLTDASGAVIDDAISAANGGIYFDPIEFTSAGVYRYQIREIAGREEGVIYDNSVYDIIIDVTESEEALIADITVTKNGASYSGPIEFYNQTEGGGELVEIPDEDVPLTGDEFNTVHIPVMLISLAMFGATVYFIFKKKEN
ncbi:MAG: Cna B-type domain-containing protein [Oscillospiraceae bacterium]|nr:Cna B-type domain-containing protein [Oscillospiraceae bacterium]